MGHDWLDAGFGAVQLASLPATSPVVSSKHWTERVSVPAEPHEGAQPANVPVRQL